MQCCGLQLELVCQGEAFLILDWFGYLGIIILVRTSHFISKRLAKLLTDTFAYYPGIDFELYPFANLQAVNIEHHVDRINAFITLVFGHIILSVLYQSSAHFGLNA